MQMHIRSAVEERERRDWKGNMGFHLFSVCKVHTRSGNLDKLHTAAEEGSANGGSEQRDWIG